MNSGQSLNSGSEGYAFKYGTRRTARPRRRSEYPDFAGPLHELGVSAYNLCSLCEVASVVVIHGCSRL